MLTLVVAALLSSGTLGSASDVQACEAGIQSARGVWLSAGTFVALYNDLELVAYLNSLGGEFRGRKGTEERVPVLPVLSNEPMVFRRGLPIYVSTGLLLQIEGREELARVIGNAARRSRRGREAELAACARLASFGRSHRAVKSRVAAELASYYEGSRPRLLIRTPTPPGQDSGGCPPSGAGSSSPDVRPLADLPCGRGQVKQSTQGFEPASIAIDGISVPRLDRHGSP